MRLCLCRGGTPRRLVACPVLAQPVCIARRGAVNLEGVAYGRVHGFSSKQSPGLYLPLPRRSRHACERGICSIAALNVGGACPTPAATRPTMLTCPSGRLLPTACAGPEGASRDRKAGLHFARSDVPPVSKVRARHTRCACSPRTHASASPVASACQAWPGQGAGGVREPGVRARRPVKLEGDGLLHGEQGSAARSRFCRQNVRIHSGFIGVNSRVHRAQRCDRKLSTREGV